MGGWIDGQRRLASRRRLGARSAAAPGSASSAREPKLLASAREARAVPARSASGR